MVGSVHVDVDSAGAVGHGSGLAEGTDDLLQVLHVLILEDGGHDFAGVFPVGADPLPVDLALGADAPVTHRLPGAALAVRGLVGVVAGPDVPGVAGAEVVGDDLRGFLPGDSGQLNLDAEVLLFHHVVHGVSSLTDMPYSVIIGGNRGKAPGRLPSGA